LFSIVPLLTKLEFFGLNLKKFTYSIDHLLAAIPFGKDGFTEIRMQQVLNTPNISSHIPRREWSTDEASIEIFS
jgi:hypothetical protein